MYWTGGRFGCRFLPSGQDRCRARERKGGIMFEAFTLLVGLSGLLGKETPAVPEPEFRPFKFPEHSAGPTPVPVAPRTLEELGVPGSIAKEMETVLHLFGHTRGDRIVGYIFRTPDGTAHALKLSKERVEQDAERAA